LGSNYLIFAHHLLTKHDKIYMSLILVNQLLQSNKD